MNKNIVGIYAGSFNPFTIGHLNILNQAKSVFNEVIIAIGNNPEKNNEREPFPVNNPLLKGIEVEYYNGLLSDYLNVRSMNNDDKEFFLIRGLRNGDDLQYEQNQLQFIKEMYPSLKAVFFICDKKYEHINSTAIRALKKVSEKEYKKYILE